MSASCKLLTGALLSRKVVAKGGCIASAAVSLSTWPGPDSARPARMYIKLVAARQVEPPRSHEPVLACL